MKILINLIGEQTAPNLIACKCYNADKIINVSTSRTKKQSDNLKNTFIKDKFEEDIFIEDAYNIFETEDKINNFINNKKPEDEIILNFTGATKPISIGAYLGVDNHNVKCIYIDSATGRILEYLNKKNNVSKINCKISIEEHFKMYGHEIKKKEETERSDKDERKRLKEYLKENYYSCNKFIKKFAKAYNKDTDYFKSDKELTDDGGANSLKWDKKEKKLHLFLSGNNFCIQGDKAAEYFTGYWFEEIVREDFLRLNIFDDTYFNAIIPQEHAKDSEAELDAVATKGYKLFIFECKTSAITKNFVYKLAAIKNYTSNIYANIYFIVFEDFKETSNLESSLKSFNIHVINYSNLGKELNDIVSKC